MTGNWAGMHACADALANLAEAARLLQGNADWIALRVEAVWLGNAADACWIKVRGLAKALDAAQHPLNEPSSPRQRCPSESPLTGRSADLVEVRHAARPAHPG